MAKTILIVDDDADWVQMISKRLRCNGYQAETAFNAEQALSQAISLKPDLILLDILMPAGGGVGVLENLRRNVNTFNTPVIALTSLSDKQTVKAVTELEVSGYFVKPIDMDRLLENMEEVLINR